MACFGFSMTIGFAGCDGCDGDRDGGVITPVVDWLIGFATDVGDWITAKAKNFSEAVKAAWKAFWGTEMISNVKPDKNDPLKGTYAGVMKCEAGWGKDSDDDGKPDNRMEITLDHPKMARKSVNSTEWELAPRERTRLDELRKQLLSAG